MKIAVPFLLATMIAAPALAGEGAAQATGASDAPSLCIVGRASDRARTLQLKPKSEAEQKRELDAIADALLRCPTVDEKVQTDVPVRPAVPAQTAYRLEHSSIPAGNG